MSLTSLPALLLLLSLGASADVPSAADENAEDVEAIKKLVKDKTGKEVDKDDSLYKDAKYDYEKKKAAGKEYDDDKLIEKLKGAAGPKNKPVGTTEAPPPGAPGSGFVPDPVTGGDFSSSGRTRNPSSARQAPAAAEETSRKVTQGGQTAVTRAMGSANTLRQTLLQGEDLPDGGGLSPKTQSPKTQSPQINPASPKTNQDLAMASMVGFGGAFTALGLKVGAAPSGEPAVLKSDGSRASEADLSALRAKIAAEPKALMRQPDYFKVLPREHFEELKTGYAERPELKETAFKDIGMTAGARDFLWSNSCSRLSGDCNAHAAAQSYRKGDDVPARDLDEVWADVYGKDGEEGADDDGVSEYTDEELTEKVLRENARDPHARSIFGPGKNAGLLAGIGSIFGDAASFLGLGSGGSGESAEGDAVRVEAGGGSAGSGSRGSDTKGRRLSSAAATPAPEAPAPAPRGRPVLVWAAAAAGLLALLFTASRRRSGS